MGQLESDGVVVVDQVIRTSLVRSLHNHFGRIAGAAPGARGFALPSDILTLISQEGSLGALAASLANRRMRPVRILFFDKTPASNWSVPWHQDRTIAVKERYDLPGFGPWTVKKDSIHVEPPVDILEDMLTLRLFADDCDGSNGPLEVACGSHRFGRIPSDQAGTVAARSELFLGTGCEGDVLAMKLLAIHRSRRAAVPAHRRVLHVDYASQGLPKPLQWALD